MKIEIREVKGITVIAPVRRLTSSGGGAVALREAVRTALDAGKSKILLNLNDVTMIDSSGIRELVSAYTTVSNRGGKLKLNSLPPRVHDVLMITQLIPVFEFFDNEMEAIASFA